MATVPNYPNVVETSPDLILASARLAHPKTPEEVRAELTVEAAQKRYDEILVRASKTHVDAGAHEGIRVGWGYLDPRFETELADAHHDLSRAKVKLNDLRLARQGKIRAHVQREEAKQAQAAQAVWRKRHGISAPEDDEQPRRARVA